MKQYVKDNSLRLGAVVVVMCLIAIGAFPDPAAAGMAMAAPFLVGDTDLGKLKELLEAQGRSWEEFKTANDALLKAKAEGKALGDLEAKVKKIGDDLDKLGEMKSAVDEAIARMQRPAGSDKEAVDLAVEVKSFNIMRNASAAERGMSMPAELTVDDYKSYKGAFFKFARRGNIEMLDAAERKAMTAGTDSEGGYLLPSATTGRVIERLYELSPVRKFANVMSISTPALEGVQETGEADAGWVGEVAARTETAAPTLAKYRIEAFEQYAAPKATQQLLDDSVVDVESWLARKVGDKFARVEGAAFIVGTGAGQPRGFTKYTTAATADATRTWGQLEHVKTGANGAFHTTQADPLFDLIAAFKPAYLQRARWVTLRSVIAAIRKFKTTTTLEYIWQPGLQAGQPDKLLGFPVENCQDMPALATDSLSMALGDFMEGYQIVDRVGIRTLRDPYTSKPYVIFYSTKRTGGGVVNFDAIKFIKFSA